MLSGVAVTGRLPHRRPNRYSVKGNLKISNVVVGYHVTIREIEIFSSEMCVYDNGMISTKCREFLNLCRSAYFFRTS